MTFGPWAVGDTFPNVGSHPTATAALNADIRILTAANDTLEIIPVKVFFESAIVVPGLIRVRVSCSTTVLLLISRRYSQDKTVGDDEFVELAKYCVRACHVLRTATEGWGMDSLNGPTEEAIENLEKYVIPA